MTRVSKNPLRILHTSDVHLDTFGDRACYGLEAVVNTAVMKEVDLLLIAGDLFDHNRVKDDLIDFVRKQLQRLSIPIAILPGNHDCLVAGSVLDRQEIWQDCGIIRIFKEPVGEILDFEELNLSIWGKPISTYEGDVRPMEGIPIPREKERWNIAVAHGYFVDNETPTFPSYHIKIDEISGTQWDYIALGHVPVFKRVCSNPVTCYSGSPSPSSSGVLVEFAEDAEVQVTCLGMETNECASGNR